MAAYTVENAFGGIRIITWTLTTADPTGDAVTVPMYADKSIQAYSVAWGGSTVIPEGSNDSASSTFANLRDPNSVAISFTSDGLKQILENTYKLRPRLSNGGVAATVTIKILVATPSEYSNQLT